MICVASPHGSHDLLFTVKSSFTFVPPNRVINMGHAVGATLYGLAFRSCQTVALEGDEHFAHSRRRRRAVVDRRRPVGERYRDEHLFNRLCLGLSLAQPIGQWTNLFAKGAVRRLTSVTSSGGKFCASPPDRCI